MTCRSTSRSPVVGLVHRDQHQIRKRLLMKLGIPSHHHGSPSVTRGTVRSTPKLPDRQGDLPAANSLHQGDKMDQERRQVRFSPNVAIQEIPSHRDYEQETRQLIWMGREEIEMNAQRNRMEYLADGFDYQKVTEERGMMRWNGELVHPATYWMRYQEEQKRCLYEQTHEALFGASSVTSMGLKKSPTMSSLASMAA